jgi:hypothetical protein
MEAVRLFAPLEYPKRIASFKLVQSHGELVAEMRFPEFTQTLRFSVIGLIGTFKTTDLIQALTHFSLQDRLQEESEQ